jgi:hypothetical protein
VDSTVSRLPDGLNNKCSTQAKHSSGDCEPVGTLRGRYVRSQTGFGMSTQTCSIPNRCASQSPSARTPNVSVA